MYSNIHTAPILFSQVSTMNSRECHQRSFYCPESQVPQSRPRRDYQVAECFVSDFEPLFGSVADLPVLHFDSLNFRHPRIQVLLVFKLTQDSGKFRAWYCPPPDKRMNSMQHSISAIIGNSFNWWKEYEKVTGVPCYFLSDPWPLRCFSQLCFPAHELDQWILKKTLNQFLTVPSCGFWWTPVSNVHR